MTYLYCQKCRTQQPSDFEWVRWKDFRFCSETCKTQFELSHPDLAKPFELTEEEKVYKEKLLEAKRMGTTIPVYPGERPNQTFPVIKEYKFPGIFPKAKPKPSDSPTVKLTDSSMDLILSVRNAIKNINPHLAPTFELEPQERKVTLVIKLELH